MTDLQTMKKMLEKRAVPYVLDHYWAYPNMDQPDKYYIHVEHATNPDWQPFTANIVFNAKGELLEFVRYD